MNLIMLVSLCVILFLQILTKRSRYKTEIDICCQQFEPFKNNSFNIQPSIRPDFFDKISKVSSIFFWPLLLVLMGFFLGYKVFWIFFWFKSPRISFRNFEIFRKTRSRPASTYLFTLFSPASHVSSLTAMLPTRPRVGGSLSATTTANT